MLKNCILFQRKRSSFLFLFVFILPPLFFFLLLLCQELSKEPTVEAQIFVSHLYLLRCFIESGHALWGAISRDLGLLIVCVCKGYSRRGSHCTCTCARITYTLEALWIRLTHIRAGRGLTHGPFVLCLEKNGLNIRPYVELALNKIVIYLLTWFFFKLINNIKKFFLYH